MCVSGYMPQKIRVGRSENLFFFFFLQTVIDVLIIMHDQGIMILLLINDLLTAYFVLN